MASKQGRGEQLVVGTLVADSGTGRVGVLMGRVGPRMQLRPPHGGLEWEAEPDNVEPATTLDELRVKVTEINLRRVRG
ncbi:hypothetical protein ABZW18_15285 [Streptomyces sp. NPDC004647]|uniref:hypothetical protein n=1 Tax=Streptomyces sp. NPDC004647 TaxID=3154671 RepID=UPI0033BAD0E8